MMFDCVEDIRENADDDDATNIKVVHLSPFGHFLAGTTPKLAS